MARGRVLGTRKLCPVTAVEGEAGGVVGAMDGRTLSDYWDWVAVEGEVSLESWTTGPILRF
jgi:hypothetical protein